MEYKRFYVFYTDENLIDFNTYLTIQLDATCNEFKHMALLSNDVTLFEKLNLSYESKTNSKTISNVVPGEFYNFLLHKLIMLSKDKIDNAELIDSKSNGSLWDFLIFFQTENMLKSL